MVGQVLKVGLAFFEGSGKMLDLISPGLFISLLKSPYGEDLEAKFILETRTPSNGPSIASSNPMLSIFCYACLGC